MSGKEFRQYLANQTNKKKKNSGEEWECFYCEGIYSDDRKNKKAVKWIECNTCKRQMHVAWIEYDLDRTWTHRVPRSHLVNVGYEHYAEEVEIDFSCELCC